MTYNRSYIWAKEYKYEILLVAKKNGFKEIQTNKIDVEEIKRPIVKTIRIKIQKALSKVNLINYGHEFGESTTLKSNISKCILNCKGWCLDDYLIGLEIEYSNIDNATLTSLKDNFEKQFDNYKIIWTQKTN